MQKNKTRSEKHAPRDLKDGTTQRLSVREFGTRKSNLSENCRHLIRKIDPFWSHQTRHIYIYHRGCSVW